MRMTISRSNGMAIAMVGALMAPTFAFGQDLAVASRTVALQPSQAQTRAAAPTIRPGEFYAAPYVERLGGPANAGRIVGTGEVPGVPLTIAERPLQSYERVFVVVPPGMPTASGTRYLAVRAGPLLEGVGQVMIPTGIITVERAQPGQAVEARIVARFEPMMIGDQLVTMEPVPANLPKPAPQANGARTTALWVKGEPVLPSLQSYVVVHGGSASGMRVGDQITFYRERQAGADGVVLPESAIAVAQIVRVTAHASTALILDQMYSGPGEGTVARVSAKMP
jgi:hypothetical protein